MSTVADCTVVDPSPVNVGSHAHALAAALTERSLEVGWSAAGFCGIAPRQRRDAAPLPQSP